MIATTLFLAVAVVAPAFAAVLPSGVEIPTYATVCRRSDPEIDACLRQSIQTLLKKMSSKGIKGVGLPPLEPLVITELLGSFEGPGYNFKNIIKDVRVRAFGKAIITGVRTDLDDPEDLNLAVDFILPEVNIAGDYKVEGLIANIPVGGRGPFTTNMTDVTGTLRLNGHLIEKDGVKYLRTHRVDMLPRVGTMKLNFENIVDGNEELSIAANQFFNNFWLPVYEAIAPFSRDAFDKVLRHYINLASLKIPYDQLIPE